jgi:hypothetical protein
MASQAQIPAPQNEPNEEAQMLYRQFSSLKLSSFGTWGDFHGRVVEMKSRLTELGRPIDDERAADFVIHAVDKWGDSKLHRKLGDRLAKVFYLNKSWSALIQDLGRIAAAFGDAWIDTHESVVLHKLPKIKETYGEC